MNLWSRLYLKFDNYHFFGWRPNEIRYFSVKQDNIDHFEFLFISNNHNFNQFAKIRKWIVTNGLNAHRNCHWCQYIAMIKFPILEFPNRTRNCNRCQLTVPIKRAFVNSCDCDLNFIISFGACTVGYKMCHFLVEDKTTAILKCWFPSAISNDSSASQLANGFLSIDVTLLGITIVVNALRLSNAPSPIDTASSKIIKD